MQAVQTFALGLAQRAHSSGTAGYLSFFAAFTGWVLLTLPTTPLEVAAAFLFGFPRGFAASVGGKTLGSALAFLGCKSIGQRVGRPLPTLYCGAGGWPQSLMCRHLYPLSVYGVSSAGDLRI